MHVPPAFREDDLAALHGTMRDVPLANLVTATAEGLVATPLPLFLAPEEGPYGTLYGHLARANPQWRLPGCKGRSECVPPWRSNRVPVGRSMSEGSRGARGL